MKRFETYIPDERLKAYVKRFVISENDDVETYKVLPTQGLVLGFQYAGSLTLLTGGTLTGLSSAGITGFTDKYRIYSNSAGIGTVLVYLTETGFSAFTQCPAIHLFSESISLDHLFNKAKIDEVTERLCASTQDADRINIVQQFLISEIRQANPLPILSAAVNRIYESKGNIRIADLSRELYISASALERKFKSHIGITPKKFASVVRFNIITEELKTKTPLIDICYHNNYFDQAHFIKDFKHFTGNTPEEFRQNL